MWCPPQHGLRPLQREGPAHTGAPVGSDLCHEVARKPRDHRPLRCRRGRPGLGKGWAPHVLAFCFLAWGTTAGDTGGHISTPGPQGTGLASGPPGLQGQTSRDRSAGTNFPGRLLAVPPPIPEPRHPESPVRDVSLQEQRVGGGRLRSRGSPSPASSRHRQLAPSVWVCSDLTSGRNDPSQAGGRPLIPNFPAVKPSSWGGACETQRGSGGWEPGPQDPACVAGFPGLRPLTVSAQ